MAEQETFGGEPAVWRPEDHGLWARYKMGDGADSYYLNELALNKARASGDDVGTCRDCGADLVVISSWPDETSGSALRWVEFECSKCGKQTAAPNYRYLRRSSRHSIQPAGYMGRRYNALKGNATTGNAAPEVP